MGLGSPEEEVPLSDLPKVMFGLAVTTAVHVTPRCRGKRELLSLPEGTEPQRERLARLEAFPRLSSSGTDNSGSSVAASPGQMRR